MATARRYGEACGIPRALDRVGERWALMIVRELMLGPKRFTDLKTGLPHASPNVLSQRLREMEETGILRKRKLPPPAASQIYELTDWGRQLEDVLLALGRWGARAPIAEDEADCGMSLDSHLLSLETLFEPSLAEGYEARIDLVLGDEQFAAEVADGAISISRGRSDQPDAVVTTDAETMLSLAHGRIDIGDAELEIEGDRRAVKRFFGLFVMPEPAPVG